MNTHEHEFDTMEAAIEKMADTDEPMPEHLHGRIMKRVVLAGYGKYLWFAGGILALNLGVLGLDLYRALQGGEAVQVLANLRQTFSFSPAYVASALGTLWNVLPVESLVATGFTVALSTYIAVMFLRIYRNPHGVRIMR